VGTLSATAVASLVAVTTWTRSRAANRRPDFATSTDQLRRDLTEERAQRKPLPS
jgi:hypothetical protein